MVARRVGARPAATRRLLDTSRYSNPSCNGQKRLGGENFIAKFAPQHLLLEMADPGWHLSFVRYTQE